MLSTHQDVAFFIPICNKAVAEQKQTYQFTHNTNTGAKLT